MGFARIGLSKTDKTSIWNFALTNKNLKLEQIKLIQAKMNSFGCKTAVYYENRANLQALSKFLLIHGYKKDYEDARMFYESGDLDQKCFDWVKKVETEEDLKIFLETFDNCYKKEDTQNPYGTLGDYLKVAESSWHMHHITDRLQYFIAYKQDKPVAVASLNSYAGMGYIFNVGSLSEVRGEGFGKLISLYCVYVSKKNGNSLHCLATEEGTYPNEFYKRIGFKTHFTGICYTQTSFKII